MTELYPQSEQKKPWQSKTLWINLIIAIGSFVPAIKPFLGPEALSTLFLIVNTILRFATKSKISIK